MDWLLRCSPQKYKSFTAPQQRLVLKKEISTALDKVERNKNATDWLGRGAGSLGLLCSETPTAVTIDLWWSVLGIEVALSDMT